MIEVEGRVLGGLDEFMLRVGHLAVLARVAHEVGGSWNRIQRVAVDRLAAEVLVDEAANPHVATYLAEKELCASQGAPKKSKDNGGYRYPDLRVVPDKQGTLRVETQNSAGLVKVTWQDLNLSAPEVRSRVGALSWEGKSGSKTGISHVCDWAQFLELIDTAGRLSPVGRLLIGLPPSMQMPFDRWNPYKPDAWILFIAYEYFRRDLDLVAQYVPLLASTNKPLSKTDCRELFVSALKATIQAAESSRSITSRVRFDMLQQLRDLEKAAKRARTSIDDLSTAWHRTASRVETLTDLGILEKKDPSEKYQYVYRQTTLTKRTAESLRQAKTADEWLDDHFVSIVTGSNPEDGDHNAIPEDQLIRHIDKVVRSLSLPTSVLPIDCLALGIVYDRLDGRAPTLGHTRRALENLPIKRPELARLARGREGTRAEYISLDLKRISEA